MHGTRKTVNELHAMLKLHEETLPKKYANLADHVIRAGRVQKNKKNKPYKGAKGGHGKGKGKMGYASNNAPFSPKPKTPPYLRKISLKKLKPGALSLYVGDGYRLAVEAIGTYHLELHSRLVIVLNNCHYAPSITRGVILVSCLFDDRFINRFDDYNVISISKNNLVYFIVIPQDGIFEIDMSYSNINDSSMYEITNKRAKINLDSSLLWHYRLGHISKKCIEKLLHDGLLNSIDIESLGKCVSCMSGKMTRKSYSHQVERAKDVLGLIHIDVCGPFKIMSRQGVFQKEVENQLGKTIKSLHSNHRGEYMSQEFLDHLKEYGIIAHRTPPYTPQNNEVSERRNRTLLDMNAEFFKSKLLDLKASGSVEDLELIQEEDTNPYVDTSLNHEEDYQENDKPQSDINPIRKSSRTRRAPDRICLYIDAKEHKLGDLDGPANYKAALMDPESKKLLDAMNVEMQSVKDNDVKVLVELPSNARTIGRKWLFKKQTDIDDIRAIRILIAIAAYYDYEIWKMDVKISFLNGHLFEEVYMEQPKGFVNPEYPNHNPGEEHRNAVKSILKYHRNTKDMFLVYGGYPKETMGYYFYYPPKNKIVVERYADFLEEDLILQKENGRIVELEDEDNLPSENTSEHPIEEESLAPIVSQEEDVIPVRRSIRTHKALDRFFIGPKFEKWLVAVNAEMQSMYDNKVWRLVVLPPNAKVVKSKWIYKKKTDMDGKVHIYRAQLVAKGCTQTYGVDYEETFSPVVDIRAIRFLIAITSYYDYEIWQMDVKTTFLNGFLEEEIYMEQPEEMKRMQNVPYALAIGSIMYVSYELTIIAMLDLKPIEMTQNLKLEAEYIAAFEAAKEAVWIRKFIDETYVVPLNDYLIKINYDNSATIIMAKESGIQKGARHFQRKYHYVHECIETGKINIVKVHTYDNLADLFTKALAGPKLTRYARSMGLQYLKNDSPSHTIFKRFACRTSPMQVTRFMDRHQVKLVNDLRY
nr:hypothetical protein [Tanacetum cinerariifolium]